MPDLAEHRIDVGETGDGTRYILPWRKLGVGRLVGLFLLLFGLGFGGCPMSGALSGMGGGSGSSIIGCVFTVPFIAIGLLVALFGIFLLLGGGNLVIVIDRQFIRAGDGVGPFRWWRKRPVMKLRRIVIGNESFTTQKSEGHAAAQQKLNLLRAEFEGASDMVFAHSYPAPMLRDLADALARHVAQLQPDGLFEPREGEVVVAVDEEPGTDEPVYEEAAPAQPKKTRVLIDRRTDGLTLTVPPAGFFKGSKGLAVFAILWDAFVAVFFVIAGIGGIAAGRFLPLLFVLPFAAAGVGITLLAVSMGKRKAILDVIGPQPAAALLITRQGLFKTQQDELTTDRIKSIEVAPTGMEVNNVPVMALYVTPHEGKAVKMLSHLGNDELDWLAALLRWEMSIPTTYGRVKAQRVARDLVERLTGGAKRDA